MQPIKTTFHPQVNRQDIDSGSKLKLIVRHAARGIVLRGELILLLYTERYEDYSLPGGGIDEGEDKFSALARELQEETGAQGVRNVKPFARYDEYRPWYKADADIVHMVSHCYLCDIDELLGNTDYESYEINNGMKPIWMNIHDAIRHNDEIIASSQNKGLSVERETFILKLIVEKLVACTQAGHTI